MVKENKTLSKFEKFELQELKTREEKRLAWERRPEKEKQKYKQIQNQIENWIDYTDSQCGMIKKRASIIAEQLDSSGYDWEEELENDIDGLLATFAKDLKSLY